MGSGRLCQELIGGWQENNAVASICWRFAHGLSGRATAWALPLQSEEETEARRGHSPCHGTGALGFYCGLSVPFVTTRHCLFSARGLSGLAGRRAPTVADAQSWGTPQVLLDARDAAFALIPFINGHLGYAEAGAATQLMLETRRRVSLEEGDPVHHPQ